MHNYAGIYQELGIKFAQGNLLDSLRIGSFDDNEKYRTL